ncbi:copper resistance protein CopC [Sporolactobacillus shoreicorticis]|uniref:Copper resistance CopC/CopD family protein n=1 Tax=Sporolactobacillus shoreicorticis TaxID=1923877 RepID=A0ABW5S3Y1_9BACL|nr:copper resistance protein CopC [Sporolactobacillus shoreicorticis]MCO7124351.1 copper resistance protein CopC [Sporolactobacillus shoreicorticis]
MKQKIGIFTAIILFSLLFAKFTSAHAYVIKSDPAQNQQASADLKTVSIQFSEGIQPNFFSLQLVDETGSRIDTNQARIDKKNPAVLENNVKGKLSTGYYRIKWKAISADGHAVHGTIAFKVGQPVNDRADAQNDKNGSTAPGVDQLIIRWLLYVGLSVYFGPLVFVRFLYPVYRPLLYKRKSVKAVLWISAGILLLGALLSLPLQVTINAGVNWLHAFNGDSLYGTLFTTSFGVLWFFAVAALLASIAALYWLMRTRAEKTATRLVLVQLFLLLFFSLVKAFLGHTAAVQDQGIRIMAVIADFLHLATAAIWLGSLFSILVFLPGAVKAANESQERQKAIYWQTIRRFSVVAFILVGLILLTGLLSSMIHLSTFRALFTSTYGQIIILKAVLFAAMLLFALFSNLHTKRQGEFLKKSVIGELILGIVVLLAAAVLTNVSPPVPEAAAPKAAKQDSTFEGFSPKFNHGKPTKNEKGPAVLEDPKKTLHATASGYTFSLRLDPLKRGPNTLYLDILNKQRKRARDLQQVVLNIRCIDMDMGESKIQFPVDKLGKGFVIKDAFDMNHRYLIKVHALDKNYQSIDKDFLVSIK